MRIYLDNAATTPMDNRVVAAMLPYLQEHFGNPSSQYSYGRDTRSALEESRKDMAAMLNATPAEIVFTSGGTEANNMALKGAVDYLGVRHIITTPIEHHCVLHTAEYLRDFRNVRVTILPVDAEGCVDLSELEKVLGDTEERKLVSIMHANNEIGVLADIMQIGLICRRHNALFHSDSVQTFAHYPMDVTQLPVDYLSGSAHKFHGPKGVGFLYMRKSAKAGSFIHGGGQERNLRAGTENVAGIVGMAEAARLAYQQLAQDRQHMTALKQYAVRLLQEEVNGVEFNGPVDENALYTVLSISLPPHPMGSLLLFQLDMKGIAVSGGSACSSGAAKGSHVIDALCKDAKRITIRCSFSRMNDQSDVEAFVYALKELYSNQ